MARFWYSHSPTSPTQEPATCDRSVLRVKAHPGSSIAKRTVAKPPRPRENPAAKSRCRNSFPNCGYSGGIFCGPGFVSEIERAILREIATIEFSHSLPPQLPERPARAVSALEERLPLPARRQWAQSSDDWPTEEVHRISAPFWQCFDRLGPFHDGSTMPIVHWRLLKLTVALGTSDRSRGSCL